MKKKLVIISGLAGSGKTVAIHALEDIGYYCIDNLPAVLLKHFVKALELGSFKAQHIALALDSRDADIPKTLHELYPKLNEVCEVKVLFLVSSEEVLLKRFRETRRQHPLSMSFPQLSLQEVIELDLKTSEPIQQLAYQTLDTSHMLARDLRHFLDRHFSTSMTGDLLLHFISFGFKYGAPSDLDTLFDVRCFKNPYYEENLRLETGLTEEVKNYVFSDPNVTAFIAKVSDLIRFLYPLYQEERKHYLSIGIGCTGGRHRSVAIVEELSRLFRQTLPCVTVEHRHISKER